MTKLTVAERLRLLEKDNNYRRGWTAGYLPLVGRDECPLRSDREEARGLWVLGWDAGRKDRQRQGQD